MFGRKSTSVCGDLNVFLAHRCVNSEGGGGQSKLSLPCIRLWAEGQFVTVCVCGGVVCVGVCCVVCVCVCVCLVGVGGCGAVCLCVCVCVCVCLCVCMHACVCVGMVYS